MKDTREPDLSPDTGTGKDHVIPFAPPAWIGWTAAGVFLLTTLFFAARSFNARGEARGDLVTAESARVEASTTKNLLEAERLLSRGQLDRLAAADLLLASYLQSEPTAVSLISLAGNAAETRAAIAWNAQKQQGVFVATRLPSVADREYRLWIIDAKTSEAVAAGHVDASDAVTRITFKPVVPVETVKGFAVSLEKSGKVEKPSGTLVLASK